MTSALAGVRVVELGGYAAGWVIGKYLGNYGAEVMRIESRKRLYAEVISRREEVVQLLRAAGLRACTAQLPGGSVCRSPVACASSSDLLQQIAPALVGGLAHPARWDIQRRVLLAPFPRAGGVDECA